MLSAKTSYQMAAIFLLLMTTGKYWYFKHTSLLFKLLLVFVTSLNYSAVVSFTCERYRCTERSSSTLKVYFIYTMV